MDLVLRPYQEEDVQFMMNHLKVYNCNDMGLGKTLETLVTRDRMKFKKTLIIAPKIALGVWANEAQKFFDWDSTIYTGTPRQRKQIWETWDNDILITNPAQLQEVVRLKNNWDMIIVDEVHLAGLLNHKTKTYKLLIKMECKSLILLTGTPIRRNLADLYGPLHLLNPDKFKSYWQFVNKYCITIDNGFGQEIQAKPKDPLALRRMLDFYMIRRTKQEVLKDLPEKIRSVIPLNMSKKQLKYYKELETDMMLDTGEDMLLTANAMVLTLRLRQMLVCPKMLGIDDYGTGIESLSKELISNDFADRRSVCICTPFRKAIPYLIESIKQNIPEAEIFEIHGDIKETAAHVAARYQSCYKKEKILIYTIKSGASFTATDASVTYFLGAEWSNTDNFQAEDRVYRIGQNRGVDIRYLCYEDTVDEEVKYRLNAKSLATHWVLNPAEVLRKRKEKQRQMLSKIQR